MCLFGTPSWISTTPYHYQPRRQACYPYGLIDRADPSQALSQELGPFARRHLQQQHGLSAWRPWLRLPLTLHLRRKRLQ
ncbi:hypothetical protein TNCV_4838411 [Trichonephila clavipes]|nr:hypothetical protein TNCV_4838411 [Trichonephila clavipes]